MSERGKCFKRPEIELISTPTMRPEPFCFVHTTLPGMSKLSSSILILTGVPKVIGGMPLMVKQIPVKDKFLVYAWKVFPPMESWNSDKRVYLLNRLLSLTESTILSSQEK
jgi:hypothetical protein